MADREKFKRSSELLLGGWKMLATCCPVCHMPLFSKGEELRCAGCDLPVKLESQADEESPGASPSATPAEQSSPDGQRGSSVQASSEQKAIVGDQGSDGEEEKEATISYEEMKRAYAERRRQSDAASAKVGTKLLQGWTMLSSTCLNNDCCFSPLMRSAPSEPATCVICDRRYNIDANGAAVAPSPEASAAQSAALPPTKSVSNGWLDMSTVPTLAPLNSEREDASDTLEDQSNKIAEFLLKGWKMLAECCANGCGSPLMRHPEGQTICVNCSHQIPVVAASRQAIVAASVDGDSESDGEVTAKVERLTRSAVAPIRTAATAATAATSFSSSASVIQEASSILEQRLVRAASDLRQEEDLQVAAEQASLVQHLATALRALDELSSSRQQKKRRGW